MTPEEIRLCITHAHGIDARVQMTPSNAAVWDRVLGSAAAYEAKAAIEIYYTRPAVNGRREPVDAPTVRKIIREEYDRMQAREDAQKALPPARHPARLRSKNPEEWDRLAAEGARRRREELAARGIEVSNGQV